MHQNCFKQCKKFPKDQQNFINDGVLVEQNIHSEINTNYTLNNECQIQIAKQNNTINLSENNTIILMKAVQQLKLKYEELTYNNQSLKIYTQNLQNQITKFNNEQYDERVAQLSQIQQLVKNYRDYLKIYQGKVRMQMNEKDYSIQHLKEQIRNLIQINATLTQKQVQLAKINSNLLIDNSRLLKDNQILKEMRNYSYTPIKLLRDQSQKLLSRTSNQLQPYNRFTIQQDQQSLQMGNLIEKLVKELEQQKNTKTKMQKEIKRLKKQIMDYQTQLMEKNNKIYLLQLNRIKSDRTLKNTSSVNNLTKIESMKKLPYTFTIIQLTKGQYRINFKTKLKILYKIVKLFERKFQIHDHSQIMIEEIEIVNFNERSLNSFGVRHIGRVGTTNQKQQNSCQDMVWNLGFIIDHLINQVPANIQQVNYQLTELKNQILKLSDAILYKRGESHNKIQEIKNLFQRNISSLG